MNWLTALAELGEMLLDALTAQDAAELAQGEEANLALLDATPDGGMAFE